MKEDELKRKQRNSYTQLERKSNIIMYLEADIKVTKMYRKGEMRRKKM